MANTTRFLAKTANGAVHVIGVAVECPIVKKGAREGTWKGMRSLAPAKVLDRKDCTKCDTHARAEAVLNGKPYGEAKEEAKPAKSSKVKPTPKPKPKPAAKPTQAGPRSVGNTSKDKAEQLAEFATEHGWEAKVTSKSKAATMTAKLEDEVITCNYIDGKYDLDKPAMLSKGGWSGILRGTHRVRKQMSLEGSDRPIPHPGEGRKRSPKAEAGDDDDREVERGVPWSADAEDVEIIKAVAGRVIEWRNRTSNAIESAEVPSKGHLKIERHPKSGDRMVVFSQIVYDDKRRAAAGPERIVRIAQIRNIR